MPSLSRSHYVYVQSKHRNSGTNYQYSINLPPSLVQCDEEYERIKVTIMNFSVYNSWYLINTTGFNTITFHNQTSNTTTVVTIPAGNYTYYRLANVISSLYPLCQCVWLQDANKLQFNFTAPHQLSFDGIYNILGFNQGDQPQGTTITSTNVMIPVPTTGIMISLVNHMPFHDAVNLDNMSGEVRASNILARIPINAPPFQLIYYTNITENDNGIFIGNNMVNELEFLFTTPDGLRMTYIPDHEMLVKVEIWTVDDETNIQEVIQDLKDIKQTLKDLFLMKHLKQQPQLNYE